MPGVPVRILLVTSNREECGVREYGRMLKEELESLSKNGLDMHDFGDEGVDVVEYAEPDYAAFYAKFKSSCPYDVIWLNHHAALHASWRENEVVDARAFTGLPIVVTQHDTFEELAIMEERGFPSFWKVADGLVVHEQVDGLTYAKWLHIRYLRQGVLPPAEKPMMISEQLGRPVVGTVGFPFPWKNFDMLIRAAATAGWVPLLIAPGIDEAEASRLQTLALDYGSPLLLIKHWIDREAVVTALTGCDATAFLYTNGNSGTSGAIRLGLAARKPLIALTGCRQFRDLWDETAIDWVGDGADGVRIRLGLIARQLLQVSPPRSGTRIAALAERDSWAAQALEYLRLFQHAIDFRKARK